MAGALTERDWQVRLHIYRVFAERGTPPAVAESARAFDISDDEMRASYERLHDGHTLFLQPGTHDVRMANPLSAVPTPYRVMVDGRTLFANCAWDSVGIPAMLYSDATVESVYTTVDGDQPARYAIVNGELHGDDGLVHFAVPFRHWYDGLEHT